MNEGSCPRCKTPVFYSLREAKPCGRGMHHTKYGTCAQYHSVMRKLCRACDVNYSIAGNPMYGRRGDQWVKLRLIGDGDIECNDWYVKYMRSIRITWLLCSRRMGINRDVAKLIALKLGDEPLVVPRPPLVIDNGRHGSYGIIFFIFTAFAFLISAIWKTRPLFAFPIFLICGCGAIIETYKHTPNKERLIEHIGCSILFGVLTLLSLIGSLA